MSISEDIITKVNEAQQKWAAELVAVGKAEDAPQRANEMLDKLYDFQHNPNILFKPTLASKVPVRTDREQTLSYFVGGRVHEDEGFALTPWVKVQFHTPKHCMELSGGEILVMGRCTFTPAKGEPTTADYTFGYRQARNDLRIFLHHSSVMVK